MDLRAYRDDDASATRAVFERAVRITAAGDYTTEQLRAWAPADLDSTALAAWGHARATAQTIVAVEGVQVVGFADLAPGAVLDMLYVDPDAGRRGVASALIASVVALARDDGADALHTRASLTARPVLERVGFVVTARQTPVVRGVAMTNFAMHLDLRGD